MNQSLKLMETEVIRGARAACREDVGDKKRDNRQPREVESCNLRREMKRDFKSTAEW